MINMHHHRFHTYLQPQHPKQLEYAEHFKQLVDVHRVGALHAIRVGVDENQVDGDARDEVDEEPRAQVMPRDDFVIHDRRAAHFYGGAKVQSNVKDEEEGKQNVENILGFAGRGQFERHAQRHGEGVINDEHGKHAVPQAAVRIVGVKNGWADHRAERLYIIVGGLFPARTCFCRRWKPWPTVASEAIPCGQHGPFRQHADAMALGERCPNVPALFSPITTTNSGCHYF